MYAPQFPITEDVKAATLQKLAKYKVEYREDGKARRFQINEPTPVLMETLAASCGETGQIPAYAVHTSTVGTIKFLLQVITAFMATHTYAAFQENDDHNLLGKKDEDDYGMGPINSYVKALMLSVEGEDWTNEQLASIRDKIADRGREDFKAAVLVEGWNIQDTMQGLLSNLKSEDLLQPRDQVRFARPSTARPASNGGPVAGMPKGSRGILCPYVECNAFDTHSLPYYFLLHFTRLLGETYADIGEALPIIRRNLQQIATTSLGWILMSLPVWSV